LLEVKVTTTPPDGAPADRLTMRVCVAVPAIANGDGVKVNDPLPPPPTMDRFRFAVAVWIGELSSVTRKVSPKKATEAIGVPEITPVAELRLRPAGKVPPIRDQFLAPLPPVALSVCEYGTPTVPLFRAVVVIERGPPTTTVIEAGGMLSPLAVNVAIPGLCAVTTRATVVNSLPSG
jgi:hypothetical protein